MIGERVIVTVIVDASAADFTAESTIEGWTRSMCGDAFVDFTAEGLQEFRGAIGEEVVAVTAAPPLHVAARAHERGAVEDEALAAAAGHSRASIAQRTQRV